MDWKFVMSFYFVCINIVTLVAFAYDKHQAIKNKWRVREGTLLGLSFIGGSVGAIMGMNFFHHKIKKIRFRLCIPIFLVLHISISYLLYVRN